MTPDRGPGTCVLLSHLHCDLGQPDWLSLDLMVTSAPWLQGRLPLHRTPALWLKYSPRGLEGQFTDAQGFLNSSILISQCVFQALGCRGSRGGKDGQCSHFRLPNPASQKLSLFAGPALGAPPVGGARLESGGFCHPGASQLKVTVHTRSQMS